MEIIAHRINTIEELLKTPKTYGVEIDLRTNGKEIILHHDPFIEGDNFEEYLKKYNHGTLILNIKTEGIEFDVINLINKYKIKNYFFLDSSIPQIVRLIKHNIKEIAIRFSSFEPIEFVEKFKGKAKWIWVDCFEDLIITKENFNFFKINGFKICLVSPDLQNKKELISEFYSDIKQMGIQLDAICIKKENLKQLKN